MTQEQHSALGDTASEVARRWWGEDDSRLLPAEEGWYRLRLLTTCPPHFPQSRVEVIRATVR